MARAATANSSEKPKKKPTAKPVKLSAARKDKLKKAQDAGGLSSVAVSHTSKATIMKKFSDQ